MVSSIFLKKNSRTPTLALAVLIYTTHALRYITLRYITLHIYYIYAFIYKWCCLKLIGFRVMTPCFYGGSLEMPKHVDHAGRVALSYGWIISTFDGPSFPPFFCGCCERLWMNHGLLLVGLGARLMKERSQKKKMARGKRSAGHLCSGRCWTLLDAVLTGTQCHININNHQFLIVHITLW